MDESRNDRPIRVDDLIDLAPPPEWLVNRVAPDRWDAIERDLGTPLPEDYKLIMTAYGSGEFHGFFGLLNPVSPHEEGNLVNHALRRFSFDYESELQAYDEARSVHPEVCTFPSFPVPGGLFPIGGDINGGSAFWLTEGSPDDWPLILYPHGFWQGERHSLRLVEFLVRWIAGELPDCFFGAGRRPGIRTNPVFQNSAGRR